MAAAKASLLEYALLGLLHQAPASGYGLRKVFTSTPIAVFSDSPGAIYPALRRLSRRRWIAAAEAGRSGRRRRVYAPTAAGREAFGRWLRHLPTREDVVRRWDAVMLQLAFMAGNTRPADLEAFLAALQRELAGHLAGLESFLAAEGAKLTLSGRLAFDSGLESYRAQARWLKRSLAAVRAGRRRT